MTRLAGLFMSLTFLFLGCPLPIAQDVPRYKVDPFWPKELPNNWIFGQVTGITVDSDNHVWVLSDPSSVPKDDAAAAQIPPWSQCCIPAPAVTEFGADGNVLKAWGGPGYAPEWPFEPHGISVDKRGNIWIGGVGRPWNPDLPKTPQITDELARDRQVLKFSSDGKLLMEIGHSSAEPVNNQDTTILGAPAAIAVDDAANEVYIADGLLNKRIVVYDSNTGVFKRGWGAYGIPLGKVDNSDLEAFEFLQTGFDSSASHSKPFRSLTDITMSDDGLLYVADQEDNRIQVFTKGGSFVKELLVAPKTLGTGSVWGITLSRDPKQHYLFVADGASGVIRILRRDDGTEVGKLGHKGRNIGQFVSLAFVALDSRAALYTGEVHFTRSWDGWQAAHTGKGDVPGGRFQRFLPAN